jgi:hypothetical protein
MRDLKNNLTPGKNSKNIQSKKIKGFGYQVLGFGSGGRVVTPYVIATGGTITTVDTDYKVHTFTGDGTFCVSNEGNACGSNSVDYMVVAGGGGGSTGGGGAGGFRESVPSPAAWSGSPLANPGNARPVSVQGYPIAVGGGGAPAVVSNENQGTDGSISTFSDITSTGGGGGAGNQPASRSGRPGGSGGGNGKTPSCGTDAPLGLGNTPPFSPPQGEPGGQAWSDNLTFTTNGGGGGATVAGTAASPATGGPGGDGATTSFNGTPTAFAGGGGGSNDGGPGAGSAGAGCGGAGGGGDGSDPPVAGTAGTTNTGGGGGGGPYANARAGGSGKVVIRYKFQ